MAQSQENRVVQKVRKADQVVQKVLVVVQKVVVKDQVKDKVGHQALQITKVVKQ